MPDLIGNMEAIQEIPRDEVPAAAQDPIAVLQAQVKKFETEQPELAFPGMDVKKKEESSTAPEAQKAEETPPVKAEEEKAQPKPDKEEVPAHMRKPDGTVDQDKLEKATQHIQKAIGEKQATLEKYKELQRKYTKLSQEVKAEEKAAPQVDLYKAGLSPSDFTPEFRDKLQKDMESDFLGTWLKATTAIVRSAIEPLQQERAQEREQVKEEKIYRKLDDLASQPGNEWILSDDGMAKFDEVFKAKPFLWQSYDPYGDALRFIDRPKAQDSSAQMAQAPKPTPVLGSGRAVPPQVSKPSESIDAQLERLNSEQVQAMASRNYSLASEIQRKKDILVKGMNKWVY